MRYVKAVLNHLVALPDGAEIVASPPDGSGMQCVKLADSYLLPAVVWMRYDGENDEWIELTAEEEEEAVNILSENCEIGEISGKEAGEKFSNDVGFVD